MSRIDDLLAQHCPEGVEVMSLGEVLRIKNGKDHKSLDEGSIPVYGSGGVMRYVDTAAAEGPSVLIPRKGSLGNVFHVEGPFWVVDTIFRTEIDTLVLEPKFLYYQLLTMRLGEMNQAGGVPSQTQSGLVRLRVPVPPLDVQREVVRVLDQFLELKTELEAELEARSQQYDYYRHQLLGSAIDGPEVMLKDVAEFRRGTAFTAKQAQPGDVPVVGNGPHPVSQHSISNRSGETVVVARSGAYAGAVSYWDQPIFLTDAFSIHPDESRLLPRFMYYLLVARQTDLHGMRKGAGVPHVRVSDVQAQVISLPPLEEQRRIVSILDKFDTLVNDLSVGLPAELEARREQYEYYRDRLLTFKELPT